MKIKTNIFLIFLLLGSALMFKGCEDAPPVDYVPETYVEFFIFVGEPLQKLRLFTTQPTDVPYDAKTATIRDAEVIIKTKNKEMNLIFNGDSLNYGYFYPDTSYKVEPNTLYELKITLRNGKILTGSTTTPNAINWIKSPSDYVYFPIDTLNPKPDSTNMISWTPEKSTVFYILNVRCLDTLDYGKYLSPPTSEMNRRTYKFFARNSERPYKELSNTNLIGNSRTPTVWVAFKWFGKHRVTVYAPDFNYLKWFKNSFFSQYHDPLMNSVTNGIGVFGSAAVARKEIFLVKNQP